MSKTILISAGHTNKPGQDRGAASPDYIEGVEALRLRDRTAELLRAKGCAVTEDGADGVNDPLKKALALARRAHTAIEYHFNAATSARASGVEVLAKPKHRQLAQAIAIAIASATGLNLRGDKGFKPDNSGQHHRLAFCEAGGLVVEVCFISNPADMRAYAQNFERIAQNVADVLAA